MKLLCNGDTGFILEIFAPKFTNGLKNTEQSRDSYLNMAFEPFVEGWDFVETLGEGAYGE